jgi:hypothetical protein
MVFTNSVVALAHVGAEKMLDVIPLDEIVHIQDCDGINVAETDETAGRVLLEIELKVGAQSRIFFFSFDSLNALRDNDFCRTEMLTDFFQRSVAWRIAPTMIGPPFLKSFSPSTKMGTGSAASTKSR